MRRPWLRVHGSPRVRQRSPPPSVDLKEVSPHAGRFITVMQSSPAPRCAYCRRLLPQSRRTGRRALYCKASHRQRAYEARRYADSLHLPSRLVVVSKAQVEAINDCIYALEAALEDAELDLEEEPESEAMYRSVLEHVLAGARPLVGRTVEPARV